MQYQENVTIEQKSHTPEAVVWRCSVTKVFLKILQNSQENTCIRVFLPAAWGLQLYWKRLWHRYFPVNFVKFLRTPISAEHLWWLLLILYLSKFQYQWQRIKKQTENVLLTAFFLLTVVKSEFSSEKDDE